MIFFKISIFLGKILIILWIFMQNFIQKYEFHIWVYFKAMFGLVESGGMKWNGVG